MPLTLKRYQTEALRALANFFDLARGAQGETALDAAFHKAWITQEVSPESIPPYLAQGFGATPYVCLRIPTGGGKTLLGTHAVATAARHFTGQDRPLALWLVPSNIIRTQTLAALRQPGHPYREALQQHFGLDGLRVFDIAECEQLQPQDFGSKAIIVVGTMQTLRVDDTSGRDVYAYKEAFEPHFERAPDLPGFERIVERDLEAQPYLRQADIGKIKRSFANLLYWKCPVVIIDEAHNARTPLSYDTFARLRPAALIEMTATPVRQGQNRSNVLYHVSAEELKAEQMIKLPIVLQAHPNWQEAVRDALLTRRRLADEALGEADYVRPIVLFQAEDKAGEVTVDKLRSHLIEQEHVAKERIAVATGSQRELDGINLFDPACPIDMVITVEALKEGWDCSFAYVFCTLQKIGSSRDMEQLLGRVLRMPYATSRKSELLNRAYAHIASAETARVANELTDKLVAMGFEELEAAQAIFPTTQPLFDAGIAFAPVLPPLELVMPESQALVAALSSTTQATMSPRADGSMAVSFSAPPAASVRAALLAAVGSKAERAQLEKMLDRYELRHGAQAAPAQLGVAFRPLPLLCIRDAQGELDLAERGTLLGLAGFSLAEKPGDLAGFVPSENRHPYLVDIRDGHLKIEQEIHYSVNLDLVPIDVTEADLLRWLDDRLHERSISQSERIAWLAKVLTWLQRERKYTLTALVRHRNQLADAVRERLEALRADAQKTGLQLTLAGPDPRGCISGDYTFEFGRGRYPARPPYYEGRYRFRKHYYGASMIGDLKDAPPKEADHEFHCAVAIDEMNEVRHWVRNIPRFPEYSFWLPTASDRFYPDFVCELNDGRLLVVEYKGAGYKTNDDSQEKRAIGEFWAHASGNLFLLATQKDDNGRGVREQLRAIVPKDPARRVIAEHAMVRVLRDCEVEGHRLARDSVGAVVAVYNRGEAYAVELEDTAGGTTVVTIGHADLAEVSVQ